MNQIISIVAFFFFGILIGTAVTSIMIKGFNILNPTYHILVTWFFITIIYFLFFL